MARGQIVGWRRLGSRGEIPHATKPSTRVRRFAASQQQEAADGNVRTEEVQLTVDGSRDADLRRVSRGAGPRPAVLVFQEIFGVNAHIRDVTERVAREGYVAIAPDYHHRAGRRARSSPTTTRA